MQQLKILLAASFFETKIYFRNKEAFFFGLVFPAFLFILFGNIWGGSRGGEHYVIYLFSGIICMTIASDALFGIGPVIRIYREYGVINFLKNLPHNIIIHFLGLFVSRIIAMVIALIVIVLAQYFIFNILITAEQILYILTGMILGTIIFGFMGLTISFFSKASSSRGFLNFVFFVMLFISGAFYPLEFLPDILQKVSYVFPLTHLILMVRGELFYLYILIGWSILFLLTFYFTFNKVQLKR